MSSLSPHALWMSLVCVALGLAVGCGSEPPRGACVPQPAPGTMGAVCGFSRPEDLEIVPGAGLMLVSQMRPLFGSGEGSIAAVTLDSLGAATATIWQIWPPGTGTPPASPAATPVVGDPACTTSPDALMFSPHGLNTRRLDDDTVRVAIVGHGLREAVELFDLLGHGRTAVLAWRGCVPLPPHPAGNDLALAADGAIVVANCLPSFGGLRGAASMLGANLGMATGDVMRWMPGMGWHHIEETTARMANGIAIDAASGTTYYSETGAGQIARIAANGITRASVPGRPDNLSWSSRGTLLVGTHMANAAFARCAFGRTPCRSAWALLEIDPRTLATTTLLLHDGSVVGAVAGAAEFNGRYYFSAVFDDRIGVWQPAP